MSSKFIINTNCKFCALIHQSTTWNFNICKIVFKRICCSFKRERFSLRTKNVIEIAVYYATVPCTEFITRALLTSIVVGYAIWLMRWLVRNCLLCCCTIWLWISRVGMIICTSCTPVASVSKLAPPFCFKTTWLTYRLISHRLLHGLSRLWIICGSSWLWLSFINVSNTSR